MDSRMPLSPGRFPASSQHYHAPGSQNNVSPPQYPGSIDNDVSPSTNSKPNAYFPSSRGNTSEYPNPFVIQDSLHGGLGQAAQHLKPYSHQPSRVPATGSTEKVQQDRKNFIPLGDGRGLTEKRKRNTPAPNDRKSRSHWRNQKRGQRQLEAQTTSSRQEATNSEPVSTLEALRVLDVERGSYDTVWAMFCPNQEYSVVRRRLLKRLGIASDSLCQEPAKIIALPLGPARASRSTRLVLEHRKFKGFTAAETFLVLDKGPEYKGVEIYIGKRFLSKYCDGNLLRGDPPDVESDGYTDPESGQEDTEATVEIGAEITGQSAGGVTSNNPTMDMTTTMWASQNSHIDPVLLNWNPTWVTGPHSGQMAPPMGGMGQAQSYPTTSQPGIRLPIRQGVTGYVPTDLSQSATTSSTQSSTWYGSRTLVPGPMNTLSDPAAYLAPTGNSTSPYVVDPTMTGQYPNYTHPNPDSFPGHWQQSSPNHDSTSDGGMSTSGYGYQQQTRPDDFYGRFNDYSQ